MDDPFRLEFVGIGAARCGTTWLTDCLRAHPQICIAAKKEMRYFNARNHLRNIPNADHARPFSWYVEHFRHARPGQIKGEFSPPYLCDEAAPPLIRQHFPDAKLLVSLRNPIDRAYSGHLMRMFHKAETRSFEQAVAERSDAIRNGLYAEQLARYFALFPREQMLIVLFEDITSNPVEGLRRVFAFLGADARVPIPAAIMHAKSNATTKPPPPARSRRKGPLANIVRHSAFGPVRSVYRAAFPQVTEQPASAPAWNYPPLSGEMRAALFDIYKDDISRLEQMLGRDLSHWR